MVVTSTRDDNVAFALAAYDAIAVGMSPSRRRTLTRTWYSSRAAGSLPPGRSKAATPMLRHFREFMAMVEGEFSLDVHDVLASDERVAVYLTVTTGFRGKRLVFDEVHLWKIVDGLLVEMRAIPFDPSTIDAFLLDAASATS
jgi:hypothetical protein